MDNDKSFWKTLDLMVTKEWRKNGKEILDDVQDWVEKVVTTSGPSFRVEDECPDVWKTQESSSGYGTLKEQSFELEDRVDNTTKVECNFSHPKEKSRLEDLMGSNLVRLTDRSYMQKLTEKMIEDYSECMNERIRSRERAELERIKNLIVTGKIPIDQAPPEMADHPVILIENCRRKSEIKTKTKMPKIHLPLLLLWDESSNSATVLDSTPHASNGPRDYNKYSDASCIPGQLLRLKTPNRDQIFHVAKRRDDRFNNDFPLISELRRCESVEELYAVAEEIIGELESIEPPKRINEDDSIPSSV